MVLVIGTRQAAEIRAHLERAYPEEGCGLLVGRDGAAGRRVERVEPMENRAAGSRGSRYVIAPEDFLAAERRARAEGREVVGFFHGHPDHPPEPSDLDRERAWPFYSYVIAGVERGRCGALHAGRLAADGSCFVPEAIVERESAAGS